MQQIFLYVIIGLLALNGYTGYMYFTTDKELTEVKATLETCQQANKVNNTTIDVKETIQEANDSSCQAQIDAAVKAEQEAKAKSDGLQSMFDEAKKKADALKAKNNALLAENKELKSTTSQPIQEMSDDEAVELVNYLDTVVPQRIEREQLYKVRDPNKN